jgi:aminopeptidase N
MLDISPDTAPPQPVRLADYRPPAFFIDTVDLAFELGAQDTRVKSRLDIRRNPAAAEHGAALHLDGEALELVSLALDGEVLGANRYQFRPEGGLTLADVPDAFTLDVNTHIAPQSNTALSGLYTSGGNFCT